MLDCIINFFGWELFSKRGVRKGNWKIIYEPYHEVLEPRIAGIKTDTWQLFNLAEDPAATCLLIPDKWDGY